MSNKKFSVVLVLVMLLVAATLTAGPMGNRFSQLPVAATSAEATSTTPITPVGYGRGFVPGTNLTEECLITGEAPVLGGRMMQGQVAGNLSVRGYMASQLPMGRGGVANQLPMGRGGVAYQLPQGRGNVANQLPMGRGGIANQLPATRGVGQGWSR